MNRSLVSGVAIGVVLMAALVLLLGGALIGPRASPSPSSGPSATPRPSATPVRPSPTPIDTSIRATAVVVPLRSSDLSLAASGIVDQIYVHERDQVVVGQLILRLDQEAASNAINLAQGKLAKADELLTKAQTIVDRLAPDATPAEIADAQSDLRLAQSDRNIASSELTEAQLALAQTELRAPFAGTVAQINVERGEQADAGATLATIGDLSGWLIQTTNLNELEMVHVHVGDTATVTFEALPNLTLSGHVDSIQVRGTGEAGNVVFAVAIKPDTTSDQLRWNMTATVRITPSD
jgi:RND family efflux transporter MFP subunit